MDDRDGRRERLREICAGIPMMKYFNLMQIILKEIYLSLTGSATPGQSINFEFQLKNMPLVKHVFVTKNPNWSKLISYVRLYADFSLSLSLSFFLFLSLSLSSAYLDKVGKDQTKVNRHFYC